MLRTMMISSAAIAVAALALPASAQVLGGLGGQVGGQIGGQVGVQTPSTAPLTGQVGQTIRDARAVTRDTVDDVRRVRPDAEVGASIDAQAQAGADNDSASADLDLGAGAMVHGSDGEMLGTLVSATRNGAGRVEGFLVRAADGTLRAVPATGARAEGDVLITGWSQAEFDRAPASTD